MSPILRFFALGVVYISTCAAWDLKAYLTITCAHKYTARVIRADKWRCNKGIDTSIADKTVITPGVLNGHDGDLSHLNIPAVFSNNLAKCLRKHHIYKDIDDFIKDSGVSRRSVFKVYGDCPYKLDMPCPSVSSMKYRNADASCNNVKNPLWGRSKIPLIRRMHPVYEDDMEVPRQYSVDGGKLPSPRVISTKFHTVTSSNPATTKTALYTGFGQFISHDMTNTPFETGDHGIPVSCCGDHPSKRKCFDVKIPEDDIFFSQYDRTCMPFTRSNEATDLNCEYGVRQQINMASSFLDLSTTYGEDCDKAKELRSVDYKGQMAVSKPDLLPIRMHQNEKARSCGFSLFNAGDPKVSESPQLHQADLIFHRLHNKIAAMLAEMNTDWDDERVYQETRRIVIAIYQHIVYDEYLVETLPDALMTRYNLLSLSSGYYTGYDKNVDPTISNVFATAGMRFGHTMLNEDHKYADRDYTIDTEKSLMLVDAFFRPLSFINREMDVNRGQLVSPSEDCDRTIVHSMRNTMFETKPGNGLDIASMNVQRGRDHGLPAYGKWRKHYGLADPVDWTAASFPHHRAIDITLLQGIYKSPEDVDVYTASISEIPVGGKAVGPLLGEMLAEQFDHHKRGDRFWYESGDAPMKFTPMQLDEIRSASLASVLCMVYDIHDIQERPFKLPHNETNPRLPCDNYPTFNITYWDYSVE